LFRVRFVQMHRLLRTLRFQLASSYVVLLMLVLALVGYIGTKTLESVLESRSEQTLQEQLGAMRGYLHFDKSPLDNRPYWFMDPSDPEEAATVGRLRNVYFVANEDAVPNEGTHDDLFTRDRVLNDLAEMKVTHEPAVTTVTGNDKVEYQIMASVMLDGEHRRWYIAEGRSLAEDRQVVRRFTRNFLIFLPIVLFVCMAVSWYSAGAVLKSLHSVERAAQEITGSNLGLQIPKRGAEDELDRLIHSFNQMSGRLKASFDQIRQFSTDVSHELRTPLTAIQGQLEVALFTATRKEQLQEAIENALQDVERLSNLVRALLLLSQSESGQIPMNKTMLDLSGLLGDLVDQFQIPAEAGDVRLEQVQTGGPVYCEADRTQLERVVTNLLSNALKYTPEGGWVRTWVEASGGSVRLVVEDSGLGIPKDHLPHIFNRFYRVPDPNPEKGLGLGLSFVAAIVKAHGGEIQVDSEPGRGSRFTIQLPAGVGRALAETPVG
jgi:heavy metal sensor kinase